MKKVVASLIMVLLLFASITESHARYYDPQSGRFTTKDPIGFEGGVNKYIYTGDNPVNYRDPWGLVRTKPGDILEGGGGRSSSGRGSGKISGSASQSCPLPPGYKQNWKRYGNTFTDSKTGNIWRYHPEDALHFPHWDKVIPGRGKERIPIDPSLGVFK